MSAQTRRTLLAVIGTVLAAPITASRAATFAAAPTRIVSLVSCLDAIVVETADRGQIAALSHEARDPTGSTIAAIARTLPSTRESAEEIMALNPDLVLASPYTPLPLRRALGRLKVRVEVFDLPATVAQSLAQVRAVARAVGHPERGEVLISRIETALAAAAPPPSATPIRAVIFQPNGFTTGHGNLMDEMMTRCGFQNIAPSYGLKRSGNIALERLIADPPEVLLAGEVAPGAATWAERVVSHPALRALTPRMQRSTLPIRLFYCGGPVLIQTAQALATARRTYEGRA